MIKNIVLENLSKYPHIPDMDINRPIHVDCMVCVAERHHPQGYFLRLEKPKNGIFAGKQNGVNDPIAQLI